MLSFAVLRLLHIYVDSHPKRDSKWTHNLLKICGIHMQITILTEVQNGRVTCQKMVAFWQKMLFLMLIFPDEGHLYVNWFAIFTLFTVFYLLYLLYLLYSLCFLFQVFSCGIRMHIPILTKVKKGDSSAKKWSYFDKYCTFGA